ncbi:MAG: deoxyribonuclease IV [Oscillospiraceae bacterium]|jgi:deoxyribonuclease-4|nr:deoxyribonuclease IV [Oscillospiraceae bacterium]
MTDLQNKTLIGAHMSVSGGLLGAAKTAVSIGADTFQFFTRNPQGGARRVYADAELERFNAYCAENGIQKPLGHAPYTLNACSAKENIREFARLVLREDTEFLAKIPGSLFNLHPGSHVGQGVDAGIELIAEALNEAVDENNTCLICLETMAGKGSEIGGMFSELAAIIERAQGLRGAGKIGVCLDTCHVFDAGYDSLGDLDGVLRELDATVGLDRLFAVHINDSKFGISSRKDRHANIGQGHLGLEFFRKLVRHPLLKHLPFYLETPQESEQGYGEEIRLILGGN